MAVLVSAAVPSPASAATTTPVAVAFLGSDGNLWYYIDSDLTTPAAATTGVHNSGLPMSTNSRPAITFDQNGVLIVAYVNTGGYLCVYTPLGGLLYPASVTSLCTGLGVQSRTSPSIAPDDIVAFEAAQTDHLWYYTIALGGVDTGLGMEQYSAGPSISQDGNQIAFEANTDTLYEYNIHTNQHINTGLYMNIQSSPSIGNNFSSSVSPWDWAAYDADNCNLKYWDGVQGHDSGLGMTCNTSPSLDPFSTSDLIAFEANPYANRDLFVYDAFTNTHTDVGLYMANFSSPSLTPLIDQQNATIIGYQVWYTDGFDGLFYYNQLAAPPARGGSGPPPGTDGVRPNLASFGPAATFLVRCAVCLPDPSIG
jgi:hypothetical protein